MDLEDYKTKDFLDEFVPKQKKLLTVNRILIMGILLIAVVFLHMHVILSQFSKYEQDKIAFLSAFTLFIAAPIVSIFLSTGLAFIPIYEEVYLKKFVFFTLLVLLLIEIALFAITLTGGRNATR